MRRGLLFILILVCLSCYSEYGGYSLDDEEEPYLVSLTTSEGVIEPDFNERIFHYTLFLPCGSDEIFINPESEHGSVILINGNLYPSSVPNWRIPINDEYQVVEIRVLSPSGAALDYFLEIIVLIEDC